MSIRTPHPSFEYAPRITQNALRTYGHMYTFQFIFHMNFVNTLRITYTCNRVLSLIFVSSVRFNISVETKKSGSLEMIKEVPDRHTKNKNVKLISLKYLI